jgi:hypothetical protein
MLYAVSTPRMLRRALSAVQGPAFRQARTRKWLAATVAAIAWAEKHLPDQQQPAVAKWRAVGMSSSELAAAASKCLQAARQPSRIAMLADNPEDCWDLLEACCVHNLMPVTRFLRMAQEWALATPATHAAYAAVWINALNSARFKHRRRKIADSTLTAGIIGMALSVVFWGLTVHADRWLGEAQEAYRLIKQAVPPYTCSVAVQEAANKLVKARPETFEGHKELLSLPWIYKLCCSIVEHKDLPPSYQQNWAVAWKYFGTALADGPESAEKILARSPSNSFAAEHLVGAYAATRILLLSESPLVEAVNSLRLPGARPYERFDILKRYTKLHAGQERTCAAGIKVEMVRRMLAERVPLEVMDLIAKRWLILEIADCL